MILQKIRATIWFYDLVPVFVTIIVVWLLLYYYLCWYHGSRSSFSIMIWDWGYWYRYFNDQLVLFLIRLLKYKRKLWTKSTTWLTLFCYSFTPISFSEYLMHDHYRVRFSKCRVLTALRGLVLRRIVWEEGHCNTTTKSFLWVLKLRFLHHRLNNLLTLWEAVLTRWCLHRIERRWSRRQLNPTSQNGSSTSRNEFLKQAVIMCTHRK